MRGTACRPMGRQAARDFTASGRYVDRLERRNGEWRIAYRTVMFDWTRIEPVRAEFPVPPAVDVVWGRRDRDDLSYPVLALADRAEVR